MLAAIGIMAGFVRLGDSPAWKPAATVFTAAVVFAVYSVGSKQGRCDPYWDICIAFGAAALASLVAMLYASAQMLPSDPTLVAVVLVNGVLVNGVSYVWWRNALAAAPASTVAPWVSATPLLAVAWLKLRDPISVNPAEWLGVILIVISMYLTTKSPQSG
jgi:drug/metabolite transporter (DMT)-like permease